MNSKKIKATKPPTIIEISKTKILICQVERALNIFE